MFQFVDMLRTSLVILYKGIKPSYILSLNYMWKSTYNV